MMRLPLSTVYIACKSQEEGPLSGARRSRSRDTWREQALVKTGGRTPTSGLSQDWSWAQEPQLPGKGGHVTLIKDNINVSVFRVPSQKAYKGINVAHCQSL